MKGEIGNYAEGEPDYSQPWKGYAMAIIGCCDADIKSQRINHVDKSVIMTAAGAVDNKIDYNVLERKGDIDMYTVFDEARIEGRTKEIIEDKVGHIFVGGKKIFEKV